MKISAKHLVSFIKEATLDAQATDQLTADTGVAEETAQDVAERFFAGAEESGVVASVKKQLRRDLKRMSSDEAYSIAEQSMWDGISDWLEKHPDEDATEMDDPEVRHHLAYLIDVELT